MRQARKREILNFIDGLQQAHGEIKEALEKHELASVQAMLAECQEFAVELGNAIEDTEGEGCVTVSHVEEYCETSTKGAKYFLSVQSHTCPAAHTRASIHGSYAAGSFFSIDFCNILHKVLSINFILLSSHAPLP